VLVQGSSPPQLYNPGQSLEPPRVNEYTMPQTMSPAASPQTNIQGPNPPSNSQGPPVQAPYPGYPAPDLNYQVPAPQVQIGYGQMQAVQPAPPRPPRPYPYISTFSPFGNAPGLPPSSDNETPAPVPSSPALSAPFSGRLWRHRRTNGRHRRPHRPRGSESNRAIVRRAILGHLNAQLAQKFVRELNSYL